MPAGSSRVLLRQRLDSLTTYLKERKHDCVQHVAVSSAAVETTSLPEAVAWCNVAPVVQELCLFSVCAAGGSDATCICY